jgi:capsid protein
MDKMADSKNLNITLSSKLSTTQSEKQAPSRALASRQALHAKYDAAQTTTENSRHWQNAGQFGMTPDQINSQAVRNTLKLRSRYEYNNGGYTKRIINKTSREVVGKSIKISLQTLVKDKMRDGEALAVPYTNKLIKESLVKLDLARISCDRLTSPNASMTDNNIDGVILDDMGINPIKYQISKYNGTMSTFITSEYKEYKASDVYHWFEQEYSEQHRGIPELTSTLDINAARRAYSKATLSTAQLQANFAMFMKTTIANPDQEAPDAMDEIQLERNMVTILPENAEIGTINASQPIDTFKEYNNEMIQEASAPGNMPHNMVKGSSQDMNFSSARFDYYIMFGKDRDIIRSDMETIILDDFIMQYINEWALLNYAQFPMGVPADLSVSYGYEVDKYIDPLKESKADDLNTAKREDGTRLKSLKKFHASQGDDWKEEVIQDLIEEKFIADQRRIIFGEEEENKGDVDGPSNE